MLINYYGYSCFKISNQGGHIALFLDPFDKTIGLNPPRGSADIVAVSHDHEGHRNTKAIGGEPFIVDGPGEYEIKGVRITGVAGFHDQEEKESNTIYLIEMDDLRVCHLGDLGQSALKDKQLEALGRVDILLVPVGGGKTIGAKEAVKIVEQVEPKMVVPMHYHLPGLKEKLAPVEEFLKELGREKKTPVEKLLLKSKDLTNKEMEVAVMKM